MNNIFQKIKDQKGAASIFITMLILTGMLSAALTVSSIVQNGIVMSRAHLNSTKAYFAAESGTERVLWRIRKDIPVALNPNTDPNWVSLSCVQIDGDTGKLLNCNQDCVSSTNIFQTLDNDSRYFIKYEDTGAGGAIFSTTGFFEDITRRVVQVQYQF